MADAKYRFSELVARALAEGPQRVRRHKDVVIVVAAHGYEKLIGKRPAFKEFLIRPGWSLEALQLTRDKSAMRKVRFRQPIFLEGLRLCWWKTRVVRGEFPDRTFDIEFWQQQGDEAIFRAAWEMVVAAEHFKHGRQSRLQRDITRVQRKTS